MVQGDTVPCLFTERRTIMDMYAENNGFQVLEGTAPFDEGYQVQGADGFVSGPYQEAVVEATYYGDADGAGNPPAGQYQEPVAEAAYYGGMDGAGNFPAEQYQETAAEYGPAAYMGEADALPVGPEQMQVLGMEAQGLYQDMVPEMEDDSGQAELAEMEDDTEQEEIPDAGETGQAAEPETAGAETAPAADGEDDEETKRARHEAAEAERKAEWEARQQAKKDALKKQQEELAGMSDEEIVEKSMKRISADTEKLTRRNMKDCVAEYIQTMCLEDAQFARMTMNPRKSMLHCFQYINRKAWDYVQDEMKADGIKPGTGQQGYGCDIPDDLCYQWAEDYFRDPSAKEDEEEEEKFVSKPYAGKTGYKPATKKKTEKKEKKSKAPEKKPEQGKKAEEAQVTGQISLLDMMPQENKAS